MSLAKVSHVSSCGLLFHGAESVPWRREETGKRVERSATDPPFNMEDSEGGTDLEKFSFRYAVGDA